MNLIYTDLRSRLTVENMSALSFIKINGPPIDLFDPGKYIKMWLRTHNNAESAKNSGRETECNKALIKKKLLGFFAISIFLNQNLCLKITITYFSFN